jgi:hypothetical protein
MKAISLTPTQHAILAYAHEHTDGKIVWLPESVKGGARKKVFDGLFNRALITTDQKDWFVSAEGYDALGVPRKWPINAVALSKVVKNAKVKQENQDEQAAKPKGRQNSKQAEVIRMLERPEGATVPQICDATGWQAHTVRATFTVAFKKKLGLNLVSDKVDGGSRVYRIMASEV